MNLTTLDDIFLALCFLGNVDCQIDSTRPDGNINLAVQWKHEPFLLLYCDRDDITKYISKTNIRAHKRFRELLLPKHHDSFITEFFTHWDSYMRKDFIINTQDTLIIYFLRFYAHNKPKTKTICKILDHKISSMAKTR